MFTISPEKTERHVRAFGFVHAVFLHGSKYLPFGSLHNCDSLLNMFNGSSKSLDRGEVTTSLRVSSVESCLTA